MRSRNDTDMAGMLGLAIIFLVVVIVVATSVAAGCMYGMAYGFIMLAAWAAILTASLLRAVRVLTARGRKDG